MNSKKKYYLCRIIIKYKDIMKIHNKEILKYAIKWTIVASLILFALYLAFIRQI